MVTMALPAHAAQAGKQPQLLLNVIVEGLDATQLNLLRDYFGNEGFNRLIDQGVSFNADFGTSLDGTAATTLLMTGASPSVTGITGTWRYDRQARRLTHTYDDGTTLGNFTNDTYTSAILPVSTLTDEARIAGSGVGQVYAIASQPGIALSLGGHSANCAIWLDNTTGNWATSTCYTEPPALLSSRNRLSHMSARLDTLSWTPLRPAEYYPGVSEAVTHYPFRYSLGRNNPNRYSDLKQTPGAINSEITSLAVELIKNLKLGNRPVLDVVSVAYTLRPYELSKSSDTRYELIDSYLRLDSDLSRLLNAARSQAGADGTVMVVSGTPAEPAAMRDDQRWQIPYGEFSTKKAASLLNVFLIARHGNGEWVNGYHDGWLYLNDQLIDDRGLRPETVRAEAAEFLERMAGVKTVYTADAIRLGYAGTFADALKRNTHHSTRGDLLIDVMPGWQMVDDSSTGATSRHAKVQREAAPTAPVIIYAPTVAHRVINTPVDARSVAPTVCGVLRIRAPNAASLPALNL